MYRAYFALPASISDPAGHPVNAVHGYLDMTARLIAEHQPDEVIHVYDHDWRPAPRVAAYGGYKVDRPPDPESLPPQFELLREVLDAFGLLQAEAPGWEADDAIGALCARAGKDDCVAIVTGDRDLLQLVRDPEIRVLFTLRGVSELGVFDEATVEAKHGVPPSRYAEYAILRGDASDGLPGVKGVGEKTARSLVAAYPNLDTMLDDARTDVPTHPVLGRSTRLSASLREASSYLVAMRDVVPIRSDVEVRVWSGERDDERLDDLAERRRIKGPVRRLRDALGA